LQQIQNRIQNSDWSSGPERRALFAEQQSLQNLSADYQRQNNTGLAKAAEIKATADANLAAQKAAADQAKEQALADANTPFKEAHPYISMAIPAVTGGLAGMIGSRVGYGGAKAFQSGIGDLSAAWTKAANAAEDAFNAGDMLSATRYAHEAANIKDQFTSLRDEGPHGLGFSGALGTGALGELGQVAPIMIDKARAQPGSPLEDETNKQIAMTEANLPNLAGRVAMGGLWGWGSGKVGQLVGKAAYGEPVIPTMAAGAKADSVRAMLGPSGMETPTTALGALKDYQTARQGASGPQQTLLPPPTDISPEVAAPASGSGPRLGSPATPAKSRPKSKGPQSKGPQASASSSRESSSDVPSESQAAAAGEVRRFLGKGPDPMFAAGGSVDGSGRNGRPFAGPLHSEVPGRTDALPTDVLAGSYVFPADFVSGLGESNTTAGMKVLQHLMENGPDGRHVPLDAVPLHYAAGGKVPIKAAGGEFIAPPHAAARWGNGDLNMAHAIFDKWVTDARANTINTLKSLPGPAQ